ncbi:hypothetical protein V1272_003841 [Bradyrhizobium sp. AZCC 1708]
MILGSVSRTRCSVQRCAAEPGPTNSVWTPVLQRTANALRCAPGNAAHTGFSSSVTGEVITRNTRSTNPEFEMACSTPGGRKMTSCLRTT